MKFNRIVCAVVLSLFVFLSGCSAVDDDYGVQSTNEVPKKTNVTEKTKIPQIKSEDDVMPTYFDISLYDEENYADIYLGKKFEFKVTYVGSELTVPTTYKKFIDEGWRILATSEYRDNSSIKAGKSVKVDFVNPYGKQIIAVFYNESNSSEELKKCPIVKFIIPQNVHYNPDSVYGQFWVNGVSNECAITDIINYLGEPSHFYAVSPELYYLDYFITEKDKRSGITVYINPVDDSVHSIELSCY